MNRAYIISIESKYGFRVISRVFSSANKVRKHYPDASFELTELRTQTLKEHEDGSKTVLNIKSIY